MLIKNRLNLGRRQRPSPFFISNKNLAENSRGGKACAPSPFFYSK
nr:MAG TPA: hypothetical protein [Caudoviricetes sp.]